MQRERWRGAPPGKSLSALVAAAVMLAALPLPIAHNSRGASTLIQSSATGIANGTLDNVTLDDGALVLSPTETAVWRLLSTGSSPSARVEHAMAPIPGADEVLLFGGWDGESLLNDTWLFSLSDGGWSLLSPPSSPRGRRASAMAPFDGTDELLLFGGETSRGPSNYTWVFNLSDRNWTRATPALSPPARSLHSLATLPGTDRVLLFGGWSGSGYLNDTWVYDLSEGNWTQLSPPGAPEPRDTFALAPVWGSDSVVLFGGSVAYAPANDTWVFDAGEGTWSRSSPPLSPPARWGGAMATVPGEDRVALFGGNPHMRDTWVYDLSDGIWSQKEPSTRPSGRQSHTMAALAGRPRALLFGGESGASYRGDTWVLNLTGFCPSGAVTSGALDAGGPALFTSLQWSAAAPHGTSLSLQLRTAPTEAELQTRPFFGPDGTPATSYELPGRSIWSGHNGDRWIQYRATLRTTTPELSPSLEEIRIELDRYPEAPSPRSPAEGGWAARDQPFVWEFRDSDDEIQSGYQLQVDDSAGFESPGFDSGAVNSSEPSCSPPLLSGSYYWRVRTRDPAGAWGPFCGPRAVRVDSGLPELAVVAPLGPYLSETGFTIYGTASDDLSGLERVELRVDSGEWAAALGAANWRLDLNLSPGAHTVSVRAWDVAGNSRSLAVEYFVNRPPSVRLLSPLEGARFNTTEEVLLSVQAEDADGDELTIVWMDGELPLGTGPTLSRMFAEGSHRISATLSDGRGHNLTLTANVSVFRVFPVPGVRILSPLDREVLTCSTLIVRFELENFTVSGGPGGPHIRYRHCDRPEEDWFSTEPIVIPDIPNGEHVIRVWLVDADGSRVEGSETHAEANFTINDPRPDLVLRVQDASLSPSRPRAGDTVVVSYRVYNWGGSGSPAFTVRLFVDDALEGERAHLELGRGLNTTGKLKWRAERGNYTLKLIVDPANSIDERTENNNLITLEIGVGPAPPATGGVNLGFLAALLAAALAASGGYLIWRRRSLRPSRGGGMVEAGLATPLEPFTIDDIFLIFRDGRLVQHTTRRLLHGDDSSEIIASMLTVIQDFVRDALSRGEEVQLGSVEYGGKKILLERSRHLVLAAVVSGPEPEGLRAEMAQTLRNIEGEYGPLLPHWDGDLSLLAGSRRFLMELSAFRAGELEAFERSRGMRGPEQVRALSEVEFYQGFARLKVAVKNGGETLVADASLDLHFNDSALRLDRVEPAYPRSGKRVELGNIGPGEKKTVAYYLDPQICTESAVDGVLTYRDARGGFHTVPLKRKMVAVVCPILYTDQNINMAMLRRMVAEELDQKDSKIFLVPPRFPIAEAFAIGKRVVESHDVRQVREFTEPGPYRAEAWYYGRTKGRDAGLVVRVSARDDTRTLEFFVASASRLALTGLLAELRAGLIQRQKREMPARAGMEQVLDPAVRDKLFSDESLLDKHVD